MSTSQQAGGTLAPPRVFIGRIRITDFRNYEVLTLDLPPGPVVLTGENGAGKTNLLEAISFLTAGRGLRRAAHSEVTRQGAAGFGIHARVEGPYGVVEIGTGTVGAAPEGSGRKVRINGAGVRSDALLEWLRVIWLVPAMDTLFTGPAADRRRFLDRLVLAIDPEHGRRTLEYEKAMRGRNRLLAQDVRDDRWFEAIEGQMASSGVAIAVARVEMLRRLAAMIERLPADSPFPRAGLSLSGLVEEQVGTLPVIALEENYRSLLGQGRWRERAAGRTLAGPHRSDMLVRHRPKDMPAERCSTGEQKALLTGLVLSHARLTGELSGLAPILLLDEIAAHLDRHRRAALFAILAELNSQVFMTGTEPTLFEGVGTGGQFLTVSAGMVHSAGPT